MKNKCYKGLIAVTMGDPAGIGPEIVAKAIISLPKRLRKRIVVFGTLSAFKTHSDLLPLNVIKLDKIATNDYSLNVVETSNIMFTESDYGKPLIKCARGAMGAVRCAATAVIKGQLDAVVTAPINKLSINKAGYNFAGHTEYLADLAGGVDVAMMFASDILRVVVATTHLALKNVSTKLSIDGLLRLLLIVDSALKDMGLSHPKIALCALNPHASDAGLFGDDEKLTIIPAIKKALRSGVNVSGPYPGDTIFTKKAREDYDVIVAMYHDQGLIPVKALSFGRTVNITLGLPFLRVSVDHGTAFDIAGMGIADPNPMIYAIRTTDNILRGKYFFKK
ncbi:MAG TPA: 4-hydroxythreonine-4-phosphate dehydrogenase PdxA [Nitrospinota bacterium]|nr:4-hydroxythreonine-4-phosphate dehydrogenase PdxA [Nitrospinota bacterium]